MDDNSNFLDLKVERDTFLCQLNEFRKTKNFTDVQIKVGDKLFDAHRTVLAVHSPVLKAMLSDQWSTTDICPISEEYVDVEIMEDLLSFFYTGKIHLTPDNVHPVCMAAHFLQIPTLLEPSVKHLCQLINVENVLTLFKFSTVCELEELNYSCLRFVNYNHENVFEVSQILQFSFKDFKNLIIGLQKFPGKMLRENTFHSIIHWTETNLLERLNELPVLLKSIPLEELPLKFLSETVSTHPLVKDSISGIETVSTALENNQTYSNPPWLTNQNMILLRCYRETQDLNLYDSRTGVWKKLADMPSRRTSFGVTVVNHRDIIFCGGFVASGPAVMTASVLMFEWATQTWSELPEMPLPCANTSAAIFNDHLYVVGRYSMGTEESALEKRVLRYSFKTKQWEFVAPTNTKRANGTLIEHKNCLYAFGCNTTTIEKYDPTRDKWTIMKKMRNGSFKAVVLHQNQFYIHGFNGLESYHPETNSIDYFDEPPHQDASLVSLNGKLLAIGGYSQYKKSDLIYEFDFPTGKWIEFSKMGSPFAYNPIVVGAFH